MAQSAFIQVGINFKHIDAYTSIFNLTKIKALCQILKQLFIHFRVGKQLKVKEKQTLSCITSQVGINKNI